MTLEEVLLFIHIVAVVIWLGGSAMVRILFARTKQARDEDGLRTLLRQGDFLGKAVFNPAGIITLAAGVWLVIETPWEFSDVWISFGFAGIIIGAGLAMAFYPRQMQRIRTALDGGGLAAADTQSSLLTLQRVALLELLILFLVVWAMVFKPGA